MSRHRFTDPDETTFLPLIPEEGPAPDETTVIPKITQEQLTDATTVIPKIAAPIPEVVSGRATATDETGLLGRVPPAPESGDEPEPAKRRPGDPLPPPVKAIKAGDDYRSIHSEFTRTTLSSVIRGTLRGTGELLITFGLIILLFAAYEVWGKTAIVDAHQDQLDAQLDQLWANEPTAALNPAPSPSASPEPAGPPPRVSGDVVARLYIPRLGRHWVVVEGVTQQDIRYAPGHYPNTAMPGQDGNFAVAGHRNRATWWDLDDLRPGDSIVVETRDSWYVYQVAKTRIVLPSAVEVVRPVPPEMSAGQLLTLTTCNPKFDNYERLIVHATLSYDMSRDEGRPAEVGG